MITDKDDISPIRELPITLDELYHLFDLLTDHYNNSPLTHHFDTTRDLDKRLGIGLFQLWLYWSKKTKDTSRFVLTIKK